MDSVLKKRFDDKWIPELNSGCWLWTGASNRYGKMKLGNHVVGAHRISWELHRSRIPEGLQVLHHCDIPKCVNPDHLFLGTRFDNFEDCCRKGRQAMGERNGKAKLTAEQVKNIRSSNLSLSSLSKQFGVNRQQISRIKNRKLWCHL